MIDLKGLKVLVTGGAGFIGSNLVDLLLEQGASVTVIDNLSNGKIENIEQHQSNSRFDFIEGTILDDSILNMASKDIKAVFHLATLGVRHSIKYPFENHKVNAEGTLKVLEWAYKQDIERFVYCSSSEIYGTAETVPMAESHPARPCTVYGASKLAGEAYARAFFKTYGMKTVVIRPFNAYGPRSHYEGSSGELIPKSIVRAMNRKPILVFGNGLQTRDFTYVKDIARALCLSLTNDSLIGGTFNVGSDFEISIKDVVGKIAAIFNNVSKIEYVKGRPGDVLRLYADATIFMEKTGWRPQTTFDSGLKDTIDWFRNSINDPSELLSQELAYNWE
jgi:UDP-glucose 4-epimerase